MEIDLLVRAGERCRAQRCDEADRVGGSSIAASRFDRSWISWRAKKTSRPRRGTGSSGCEARSSNCSIPVRVGKRIATSPNVAGRSRQFAVAYRPALVDCASDRAGDQDGLVRRASSAESAGSARITQIERVSSASPLSVGTRGVFAGCTPGDATSTRSKTSLTHSMTPLRRAEVLHELRVLARERSVSDRVVDRDVGATEPVDRLLRIADDRQPARPRRECEHFVGGLVVAGDEHGNLCLDGIGVLELVDEARPKRRRK